MCVKQEQEGTSGFALFLSFFKKKNNFFPSQECRPTVAAVSVGRLGLGLGVGAGAGKGQHRRQRQDRRQQLLPLLPPPRVEEPPLTMSRRQRHDYLAGREEAKLASGQISVDAYFFSAVNTFIIWPFSLNTNFPCLDTRV